LTWTSGVAIDPCLPGLFRSPVDDHRPEACLSLALQAASPLGQNALPGPLRPLCVRSRQLPLRHGWIWTQIFTD
jgi:hypothetical protein